MPKENTNCIAMSDLRVEVAWAAHGDDREGHVQIATVHTNTPATIPGERRDSDTKPEPEPLDGWHATLDRDGCNRIIRSLRRARDAAYGADA